MAGLDAYTYLLSLSLSHNRIDSLIAAHFPFTLTHLDISHNRLTSLEGLQGLPYLSWLDASHNEASAVGTRGWHACALHLH